MTATITDLFCGAGGSSLGAEAAGGTLVIAANHWQTAIDVHQHHFPDAAHDCADISQADPRRYPRTDILLASPECTNHSQARGISRKQQDPTLWDAPDPEAERSRATMWDVVRFAEQMRYAAIVVENVVEATKWILFPAWYRALQDLGYTATILSHNSMHHGVPQSRDRIYIVWTRDGLKVDLERELDAWCARCGRFGPSRQSWKTGRTVGRYNAQWIWTCTRCTGPAKPATVAAETIIDWDLVCPRIGDRERPLAPNTRLRILAGLQRYGWAPITTTGAGNGFERTPGNRARPITEPVATQTCTGGSALATPPGFALNTAHGGRLHDLDEPHPTVCASDDRLSLVMAYDSTNVPRPASEPLTTATTHDRHALLLNLRGTDRSQIADSMTPPSDPLRVVSAGGIHHGLVVTNNPNNVAKSTDDPLNTITTSHNRHGLLVTGYGNGDIGDPARRVSPTDEPTKTLTTTTRPSLLMRNNNGGAEMCTPVFEPARTFISKPNQALLVPGVDLDELVDNCGFRMLEPYEVAAAMAFPAGYIPLNLPKSHQVKLAGNAVTPPVMAWIVGRIIQAMERAA